MKKNDIILLAVILLLGGIGILLTGILKKKDGTVVLITTDGKKYGTYSLSENQSIEVRTEYGWNFVVIADGKVFVRDADCPDKYCVKHAAIFRTAEPIVCLPHKMIVEIRNDGWENGDSSEGKIDGVAR